MNRETRTRWYNHKCSKCSPFDYQIIIRIVLYALVRYLRPTLYIKFYASAIPCDRLTFKSSTNYEQLLRPLVKVEIDAN